MPDKDTHFTMTITIPSGLSVREVARRIKQAVYTAAHWTNKKARTVKVVVNGHKPDNSIISELGDSAITCTDFEDGNPTFEINSDKL